MDACKAFAEMLEVLSFKYMPSEIAKVLGDRGAGAVLFRIVKEATKNSIGDMMKKEFGMKSVKDAMLVCYKPFEVVGKEFEYELASEDPLVVRVKKCPHFEYTKNFPLACVVCAATKAGTLEALTGKKVRVETEDKRKFGARDADIVIKRTKHMPKGDPYCEFVVKSPA